MEILNKTISTQTTYVTPEISEINLVPIETILQASQGQGTGDDFGYGGID